MLQTEIEGYLREQYQEGTALYPAYDDYCFANIPGTAASVLNVDVGPTLPNDVFGNIDPSAEHVVVILLDGLGWKRWQRDSDDPVVSSVSEQGVVTPLTSIVPSATVSAITTIHTARPAGTHGVFGRSSYIPPHNSIVHSFSFSEHTNTSAASSTPSFPPRDLITADPIYPRLEQAGVRTQIIQPAPTLGTNYANVAFRGATQMPVEGPAETAAKLREVLESATAQTYTYVYLPQIDTVTHDQGQDSEAYHRTLADITRPFKRELGEKLDAETAADTLVFVTADHGMIDMEPGPPGCLDLRDIEAVYDNLRRVNGVPGIYGAQQMTHLLVDPETQDTVITALERENVDVYLRKTIEDGRFFGGGSAVEQRCGDLVITHRDHKLIHDWAESVIPTIGQHGGLRPGEMLIPFGVIRGSKLKT